MKCTAQLWKCEKYLPLSLELVEEIEFRTVADARKWAASILAPQGPIYATAYTMNRERWKADTVRIVVKGRNYDEIERPHIYVKSAGQLGWA